MLLYRWKTKCIMKFFQSSFTFPKNGYILIRNIRFIRELYFKTTCPQYLSKYCSLIADGMVCGIAIICSIACGFTKDFIYGLAHKFAYDLHTIVNDIIHGIVRNVAHSLPMTLFAALLLSATWLAALLGALFTALPINLLTTCAGILMTLFTALPAVSFAAMRCSPIVYGMDFSIV